ncbi:MAG: ornithine cyclodeaminase family protein [Candidatus Hodarchaeota archaeon]
MSEVLILAQDIVKSCLPMKRTIQAVREAYVAFAKGRVQMPPVMHLDVEEYNGEVDIKSGYIQDLGLIGTKIASGYYDNHKLGLPPGVAVIILMDLKTSMPIAIMDGTYITATRTGAAGAVAANVLARKDSQTIGIVGAGTQGRMQALALSEILKIDEVRVWDLVPEVANIYSQEMPELLSASVKAYPDIREVVQGADIVVTVTPSRKALVVKGWIDEGTHINAIGADGPGKQELDPELVSRADKIVVDSLSQCRRIGEIQHALQLGLIKEETVHGEIGEILLGRKQGRETSEEITLFDSTGLAAQDIAAASVVYEEAKRKNLGHKVRLLGL